MGTSKTVALRGSHGWECFWHLFRVLSHFSMDQCPPHINFTWVRSKSKHSRRRYGCLVLESFGTRPLDIIVQSTSKQHMLSMQRALISSSCSRCCFNRFMVTQYMAYDIISAAAEACAEDFSSNRTNIHWTLCGAFRRRPSMRAPLGAGTYLSPDFYFHTCNLRLNRSAHNN